MVMVLATLNDTKDLPMMLKALSTFLEPGDIKVLEELTFPVPHPVVDAEFEALAEQIAGAIRPTAKQPMRKEALYMALFGGETLHDQHGESDPSLRNALGALSKALRPIFKFDASPIDNIAQRKKYFGNEGHYLGTKYQPTKLGVRVRDILRAQGAI